MTHAETAFWALKAYLNNRDTSRPMKEGKQDAQLIEIFELVLGEMLSESIIYALKKKYKNAPYSLQFIAEQITREEVTK